MGLGVARSTHDLTIPEMKKQFMEMAREAFRTRREGPLLTAIDPVALISQIWVFIGLSQSVYPTTPLRRCLQRLFGEDTTLYGPPPPRAQRTTRVAVTAVRGDGNESLCLMTNYNRKTWDNLEREDQYSNELRVWEAGLATAAAPVYFRAFEKPETQKAYLDGGLKANFPGEKALQEMSKIWAFKSHMGVVEPHLDLMVTVGTGVQSHEIRVPFSGGGFDKMVKMFSDNLDSEHLWQEFSKLQGDHHASRTVRLNSSLPFSKYIPFYEYKTMDAIAGHVEDEGQNNEKLRASVRSSAAQILATFFFFQPDVLAHPISRVGHGAVAQANCSGSIRCRLARGSPELAKLIDKVDGFFLATTETYDDPR